MNNPQVWSTVQRVVLGFWISIPIFFLGGISLPLLLIAALTLLVLHALELPVAFFKLRGLGVDPIKTVVKTLTYGFTWWLPVSKGVINA